MSADFEAGLEAYNRGDYKNAFLIFNCLAEQGDAAGQYQLGVMYAAVEGIPQDDVEAARRYRMAAEQGNAVAQWELGFMHSTGEGVPKDDVEAARWFVLAVKSLFLNTSLFYIALPTH